MTRPVGPMPTLWHGKGATQAFAGCRDLLRECQPPAVQLHTWEPARIASQVRALVPGVTLVVGVGIDGLARDVTTGIRSVDNGVAQLVTLARRAQDVGAVAICWNAEAGWKRPPSSPERARLASLIRQGLAAVAQLVPGVEQWHTAYDHPSYHSTYPWEAWLGPGSPIAASLPQVYAAPGGDVMAHRGALPAREARALASWRAAVRAGWIREDAPEGTTADLADCDWLPYYQLHHVRTADTVSSAVRHPLAALWALPTRSDDAGRLALRALCALHRGGWWGRGGIERFQASAGLTPDGVVGPRTLAALGVV